MLVGGMAHRPHAALGASGGMLARLLGGRIYLGTLLGGSNLVLEPQTWKWAVVFGCACVAGTAVVAVGAWRGGRVMRLFVALAAALLASSLLTPAVYPPAGETVWRMLLEAGPIRYWFFPSLAFAWALLFCMRGSRGVRRVVWLGVACTMRAGIVGDWEHPAFADMHYAEAVRRLESAPAGTVVVVPLNPAGWEMRLTKHAGGVEGW
jgi:hypothetical protein